MIDLHLHLDGSLDAGEIFELAALSGVALPADDKEGLSPLLSVSADCRSLAEYLEKFELPLRVLQTAETIEKAVYSLIKRLSAQGLFYAEIRFAPQLHLRRGLTQGAITAAAVRGLEKGCADFDFSAQLILCCMRGADGGAANAETVRMAKKFLKKGVCCIDLAGNEAAYPTADFCGLFDYARENQVPFVIHAGEAAGAESVKAALEFGAVRIGHGIHALEDGTLTTLLKEKKTVLELCYTSNLQTKAVESPIDYPLIPFVERGVVVTLNTDNMTVSLTTLKNEYRLVKEMYGLSEKQLIDIALNAADGAFVDDSVRIQLKDRIKKEFSAWLAQE